MRNTFYMVGRRRSLATLMLIAVVGAKCGGDDAAAKTPVAQTIGIPPEQIHVVATREIRTGPSLAGSLEAETQATVRSEIGGAVLQTFADAGQPVRGGQELVRIDESSIRDAILSAQSVVTTARNQVDLAQREVGRADALAKAGAIPDRQVELARSQLVGAQAMETDARARLSSAQKQLEKTIVKAPFNGIVSVRSVNGGDVIGPGAALYTIINPSTMRLEASVPSDALASIRLGAPVEFTISGYPTRRFTGRISAINPTADPATRQVRVIVTLPNQGGTLIAGLFAEGRVASEAHIASVVPASAVDETGVRPWVMRIKNGKTERAEVELGIRDQATEVVEIRHGLAVGDTVLLGGARGISPATPVRVTTPNDVRR